MTLKRVKDGYKAWSESQQRPLSKKPKSRQAAIDQLYAVFKGKQRRGVLAPGAKFKVKH